MPVRRLGLVMVTAALVAAASPQAASAGVGRVIGFGDPRVPPSELRWDYVAARGETNDLTITTSDDSVRLRDSAGITAAAGCTAVDAQTVTCGVFRGEAKLGDRNDRALTIGSHHVSVFGGYGNDVLISGPAGDLLNGDFGDDKLTGGGGGDSLYGSDGKDTISAVDGAYDDLRCGFGTDRVLVDRVDTYLGCERRKTRGRRRTVLTDSLGDRQIISEAIADDGSGPLTADVNVRCAQPLRPCTAVGQLVYGGNVIATGKASGRGFVVPSFTFTREQVGSPQSGNGDASLLPVTVRVSATQGGHTDHSSWPLLLVVPAPPG
jgi:hypothetical protein